MVAAAIEEDKLSDGSIFANTLLEPVKDLEGFWPAGVIGFVIPGDQEKHAKLAQLVEEKVEVVALDNVANVAESQIGGFGDNLEEIVGFWRLEMKIGKDLNLHIGMNYCLSNFRWRQ